MDILLQDTTKEPLDLPDNPHETLYTNSVPNPRISDAELEAELEKLSLSEGGMELFPRVAGGHVTFWLTKEPGIELMVSCLCIQFSQYLSPKWRGVLVFV